MIAIGDSVQEFSLQDHTGTEVTWSSLRGKPAVFFFYPKANTPGCTKEACGFRDLQAQFDAKGVAVFGISADTVKRQSNFQVKYELTMPLLADTERTVIEGWGVWQEKKNYGRTYMGVVRSTFLFDADGKVAHVWSPVRVKGHTDAVLAKVNELF